MRRLTALMGFVAALAACDSAVGPTATDPATTSGSGLPQVLQFAPEAPPLMTYDTTHVIRQGQHSFLVIYHQNWEYFLSLDIPPSAQFVDADGMPAPDGQPVTLRARVDSTLISFEFEPHGSYFTGPRPVVLWVGLKYVDLGAGTRFPSIWYQADATDPWSELPTTVDRAGKWLKIELRHFSNYAVAW